MKKGILLMLLVASTTLFAQQTNPFPKTITVTGTAEREVVPDEIYVNVLLREYDKKGQGKIPIDRIKQDFLNAVKAVGIPDSLVSIAAYDAYQANPWLRKKKKKEELFASITYQLKLRNSRQMDDLVNRLDDDATQNFYIQKTTHSQLEAFKKQLKIEAVKNAKEKAGYLAGAIDEKIGTAITINEPHEYYQPYYNQAMMMRESVAKAEMAMDDSQQPVDFRKIKLRYDVTVVFALQ